MQEVQDLGNWRAAAFYHVFKRDGCMSSPSGYHSAVSVARLSFGARAAPGTPVVPATVAVEAFNGGYPHSNATR